MLLIIIQFTSCVFPKIEPSSVFDNNIATPFNLIGVEKALTLERCLADDTPTQTLIDD